MEILLENKQKHWHKRIDRLHLYIQPSWNRRIWIRTLAETLDPSMWDPPVSLNHKIQTQFRLSRKDEVNTFRLLLGHCKVKFSLQNLENTFSKMLLWFLWRNSETFLLFCNMNNEPRESSEFEAPCRKLSKTRTWLTSSKKQNDLIEFMRTCVTSSCLNN